MVLLPHMLERLCSSAQSHWEGPNHAAARVLQRQLRKDLTHKASGLLAYKLITEVIATIQKLAVGEENTTVA